MYTAKEIAELIANEIKISDATVRRAEYTYPYFEITIDLLHKSEGIANDHNRTNP